MSAGAHTPPPPATNDDDATLTDCTISSLKKIINTIDSEATIDAVVKMADGSTMIRVTPSTSEGLYNTRFLAMQTGLRVAFPFDSVAVVENVATGTVQLQVLIQQESKQLQLAKGHIRAYTSMKLLSIFSNLMLLSGAVSFVMLLQHDLISQSTIV